MVRNEATLAVFITIDTNIVPTIGNKTKAKKKAMVCRFDLNNSMKILLLIGINGHKAKPSALPKLLFPAFLIKFCVNKL